MNKVKGFNYDTIKHKSIIDHIKKQPNQSQYIWVLVERDMKNNMEDIIRKYIDEYLRKTNIKTEQKTEINTSSIKEILNM